MIKLNKSRVGGVIFLLIGLYMALSLPDKSLSFIMPFIYGIILIVLSAVLIIRSFVKKNDDDVITIDFNKIIHNESGRMLLYILFVLAYVILIKYVGTVSSTVIFIVISYFYMGIRTPKSYIIALGVFTICYLLFAFVLGVHFPHGMLY